MSERFGVVRGLSSEDAYSMYALLYFRSDVREGTIWRPDPLDEDACIAAAQRDERTGEWVLRYSCLPTERALGAGSLTVGGGGS